MKELIAIQGIEGSFHHQVAKEYFGSKVEVATCMSFQAVADNLLSGAAGSGVLAIENSTAGAILPNYALIDDNDLNIVGEHYIPINMNLMALPGQRIEDIKKVYSHPMALMQCSKFFMAHPQIKLVEDRDTAEVAQRISQKGSKGIAAIGSEAAAEIFGLEILAPQIHTIKSNVTRFLILSMLEDEKNGFANKASIRFEIESKKGSLAGILNVIKECDLDMTKIQSIPVPESPWKYAFFLDVTFAGREQFEKAIEVLKILTENLKVFGTYKNKLV